MSDFRAVLKIVTDLADPDVYEQRMGSDNIHYYMECRYCSAEQFESHRKWCLHQQAVDALKEQDA